MLHDSIADTARFNFDIYGNTLRRALAWQIAVQSIIELYNIEVREVQAMSPLEVTRISSFLVRKIKDLT